MNRLSNQKKFYYSYNQYLQTLFQGKTYKISLSSGLSCPTRDGSFNKGGCTFCDVNGSQSYFGKKNSTQSILNQIENQVSQIQKRFHAQSFLAYFQSYTNTYTDIKNLRSLYTTALSHPKIQGLCIGTRPDCIPDSILFFLEDLAQKHYVSLELGIQSLEENTLSWFKRGHSVLSGLDALERIQKNAPHLQVCVHFIFGSPFDPPDIAQKSALFLNASSVHGVKLHQLMVLKRTQLAHEWKKNPFPLPSLESYGKQVLDFLNFLRPSIYIERLYALATHPEDCLAPEWSKTRWKTHNAIHDFLIQNDCQQGSAL